MDSRYVSVGIQADPEAVYEFAADPQTWSKWAAGVAEGGSANAAHHVKERYVRMPATAWRHRV